jgi:hypothetical protein
MTEKSHPSGLTSIHSVSSSVEVLVADLAVMVFLTMPCRRGGDMGKGASGLTFWQDESVDYVLFNSSNAWQVPRSRMGTKPCFLAR